MNYASVCSGIEAATVAWHPLGWTPSFFSEIEPFPCAVLAHHYPDVRNHGDMNLFRGWSDATIDVLVGGTPCQSFSVAGLRAGLADPRGNLALTYLAIAERYRPRWILWENVPGVLSSSDGVDFGSFLWGLAQLGYGWSYRVLDAQYFGVPQRRRRVFVVGSTRGWGAAAAVLFEPESLQGHPAPSREPRQNVAGTITQSLGHRGGASDRGDGINLVTGTLDANHSVKSQHAWTNRLVGSLTARFGNAAMGAPEVDAGLYIPVAAPLTAGAPPGSNQAGRRREDDVNLVAFDTTQITSKTNRCQPDVGDPCHPLAAGAHAPAIAFANTAGATALGMSKPGVPPVTSRHGDPGNVLAGAAVRRLTPRECERLQGFPDDYTLIPLMRSQRKAVDIEMAEYYRRTGQEFSDQDMLRLAKDAPRYKALGNSMAVPVMRWLGERIELVESVLMEKAA